MKTLVIIVSYNFEKWIERCLGSLRQSKQQADVVVIDNCSTDNTVALIEKHYPEVRLLKNSSNLGFGQANNIGMSIALQEGYEAVFLLNQDAWIDPSAIETLLTLCESNKEYGILSPVHLTGSGHKLDPGFATYTHTTDIDPLKQTERIIPASFINAAFWMIPTRVLRMVGGFSPLFYHYGEDKDYVNRLRYHGFLVGYSPQAFGCHDREYRTVSRDAFFRSEQVYLLSEYANINYSFFTAFGYGILAGIQKAAQSLRVGKWKEAYTYFNIACKLTLRTAEILRARKETIRKTTHYI